MTFELKDIVPWGRSFEEYRRMFSLTAADLFGRILGAGDGPASFNAEATQLGHDVISVDPIYAFSRTELASRFKEVREEVLTKTAATANNFLWDTFPDVEALGAARAEAMRRFLEDGGNTDPGTSSSLTLPGEAVPSLPQSPPLLVPLH